MARILFTIITCVLFTSTLLTAYAASINFDDLTSSSAVTNIGNVTFSSNVSGYNLIASSKFATSSLPNSLGVDDGGLQVFIPGDTITLTFAQPVTSVSVKFISSPLTPANAYNITTSVGSGQSGAAPNATLADGSEVFVVSFSSATPFTTATLGTNFEEVYSFNIDDINYSPTVSYTSTPLNYSNQASGTIAFNANESANFECKVDNGAYAACTSPFSYSNLTNGQHTVTIRATDGAGNISTSTYTWTVNTALAVSSAILLPQTGQTKCYNAAGTEDENCSEITSKGQDGDIQAGIPWPTERFINNGDASMSDKITGLQWAQNGNLMITRDPDFDIDLFTGGSETVNDGKVNFQHALDYIQHLNGENYLGHSDWRLPNVNELGSLINHNYDSASWLLSVGFTNFISGYYYWSSSPLSSSYGYIVQITYGNIAGNTRNGNNWVLPVRNDEQLIPLAPVAQTGLNSCYNMGIFNIDCTNTRQDGDLKTGVTWPSQRFTANGEMITDNLSGLILTKDANAPSITGCTGGTKMSWQEALNYVTCINTQNYLGHNDWRMPNRNEVLSIFTGTNSLLSSVTTNIQVGYWTSSTDIYYKDRAWLSGSGYGKSGLNSVWPVRGGYVQQKLTVTKSGTGTGTITPSSGTLTWVGNTGTARYEMGANTVVTLTAAPSAANYTFTGWTDCDSTTATTCTVTMNAAKNVTATFTDPPPSAPTNIETQTPTIKGQINTTWTKPSDIDFAHIHIYRSTVAGTLGTLVGDNQTGIKYTDTGLASQTKYYYTVRSVDAAGNESTNTAQVFATTLDATPPPSVTGGAATNPNTGGRLNLSWNASTATDLSFYRIYRSTGGVFYDLVYNNVLTTTYSDTGLTNGQQYWYSFTAVDTSGNESAQSAAHNMVFGTPTAPDTTPPPTISCTGTISQPAPLTGDKLQLTWTNPVDPDYALTRIYASTASGTLGSRIYEGTASSYSHTGLTAGATYYYTYHTADTYNNETTNTNQCSFIPVDSVAPSCPTAMTAVRNNDNSATISWVRSPSPDIATYRIYGDNGSGTVSYAAPLASVNHPTVTWTSGILTTGKTYQFTIRPEDGIFPTPNINSSGCGMVSVGIPAASSCSAAASIKVPNTGKKLGGNNTTVIAEITSGSETDLGSVTFQYRVSDPLNEWTNIPSTDNITFPNPDITKPWFVHWNIVSLTQGQQYDIRAVATCANSFADQAPGFITVSIDHALPESEETSDAAGSHKKDTAYATAPLTLEKGDDNGKGVTKLILPEGSLSTDTGITVTQPPAGSRDTYVPGGYDNSGVFREINFVDGRHTLENSKKADLEFSYRDDDNNGIVDGTSIKVNDLQICDYNSVLLKWTCLDSIVDTTKKTVRAKTQTFSLFGLLVPPRPVTAGWNMLSVPLTPVPNAATSVFANVSIYYNYYMVMNPATGTFYNATTVAPGKGYFIKGNGNSFTASGTETPDASFSIPIYKGWNMIGNPFRYKVRVADLRVICGSSNYSISEAETAGLVDGTLFGAENSAFQMYTVLNGGTINPWKGYYILSDADCTLVVPNTPAQ